MANTNRFTKSYLEHATKDRTELYQESFMQLIRYLEANAPLTARVGYSISPKSDFARFGQKPLLHFFPAAFCEVNYSPEIGEYKIKNSYFGLLGINGPLPAHLTEHAVERKFRYKDPTFSEFLDMFNHRFISLFYRAWADAEPAVNYDRPHDDNFQKRLNVFSGDAGDPDENSTLPYQDLIGLLSHKNRSRQVLIQLLTQYLGLKVELEEFYGQWYDISDDDLTRLGRANMALGSQCVLGARSFERSFSLCILIGPVNYSQYLSLVSTTKKLSYATDLIRKFIGYEYDFSIKIFIGALQTRPCRLGSSLLGLNSWSQAERGHLAQLSPRLAHIRQC